jgi:hypothetical protein
LLTEPSLSSACIIALPATPSDPVPGPIRETMQGVDRPQRSPKLQKLLLSGRGGYFSVELVPRDPFVEGYFRSRRLPHRSFDMDVVYSGSN